MKITVIGTGYVGLVTGTCFADMGNYVTCVDNNAQKIETIKAGIIPIYEPGLEELLKVNVKEKRLSFSTDLKSAVQKSDVCFIAVGTPQDEHGAANLQYVFDVAKEIAKAMNGYKVIVTKSTVPVGTAEKVQKIIAENTQYSFDVVSNPEFLKQGNAVDDFLYPDRVIIGSDSKKAIEIMQEVYASFFRTANRIIIMDIKSAEMTKYASNAFLATKISFMNEIALLCEKVGADAEMVRVGMSTDQRIGNKFLFPGLGYGGSCFPKDVKALSNTAKENDCTMTIIDAVDSVNIKQRYHFIDKILHYYHGDIKNKRIGIWGLSFKPKTDDMREAPAITIINALLGVGAKVCGYDPKAMDTAKKIFADKIEYADNVYDCIENCDCMLLLTEWNEFRRPDFERVKALLKEPIIFDGRNLYNKEKLNALGFEYFKIG